ncbi:glycosyltransferase family 4 protein [Rugosimonospora africana]|uniref:Glycosyl transferase n=1 Tax=Rugosimonospora africana TaxID=556532 RepID=A0A8J3R0C6_9ACTN|nr:glycosyltransferase family 4 protein [Rugosimonospora africana]GIH19238.1 glycosyl transferase [Rugosimonospora africana]
MTAQVALVLASSTGGIGRHIESLSAGLVARGSRVTVYGPAATADRFHFAGDFVPVEIPASPHLRDARAVATLRRALAARRPDIVHAHGLRAGLVAGWARPAGVPLVVTWHNPVPAGSGLRGRLTRTLATRVARSAQVTLGASTDLVERATALGGTDVRLGPVAAPELVADRSPAQVRQELGIDADAPLIVSVGRLHPQKGYAILIEASVRWGTRRPAPVVAIAGTGPLYMTLASQISNTRAPVILLGHRGDVADLLGAADLAVVSSVWEARQLFVQEAMRAGVPLVATAVGGLPDLIGDGGLMVPPGDVDALDEAVTRLLDDPKLAAEYRERSLDRARQWPSEAQTVDQVAAVYAELTGLPVGG